MNNSDILNEINRIRGISITNKNEKIPQKEKSLKERQEEESDFLIDLIKEGKYDKLKIKDLLNFFVLQSKKSGKKYIVSSYKKDLRPFKILKEKNVSNEDIINIIDFIFNSPQNYLDKSTVTPFTLYSSWFNKLLEDSKLWKEGKYKPSPIKKKVVREWKGEKHKTKTTAVIGEW